MNNVEIRPRKKNELNEYENVSAKSIKIVSEHSQSQTHDDAMTSLYLSLSPTIYIKMEH